MERRVFLRTALLGGLGAIFVPRYERWFRPIVVPPPGLTLPWPSDTVEGDVAVLMVQSRDVMRGLEAPPGWSLLQRHVDRSGEIATFTRLVQAGDRQPRLPKQASVGTLATFRGVLAPRQPAPPVWTGIALAGPRTIPTFVGHRSVRRG
jgi:hypothetical protein